MTSTVHWNHIYLPIEQNDNEPKVRVDWLGMTPEFSLVPWIPRPPAQKRVFDFTRSDQGI